MTTRAEINIEAIALPRPVNFLRVKDGGDEMALDVALFSDDTLKDVARRMGEAFLENARKRREAKAL
jgi:hypothetical protein